MYIANTIAFIYHAHIQARSCLHLYTYVFRYLGLHAVLFGFLTTSLLKECKSLNLKKKNPYQNFVIKPALIDFSKLIYIFIFFSITKFFYFYNY